MIADLTKKQLANACESHPSSRWAVFDAGVVHGAPNPLKMRRPVSWDSKIVQNFANLGHKVLKCALCWSSTRNLVLPNQLAQVHKQLVEDVRPNFY